MSEAFEAKKHAYRQTQDGIVVSFVVHPNDLPKALALASLGTRYMVGVEEIGDDEKPKDNRAAKREASEDAPRETVKERREFKTLSLAQQSGIRCHDDRFQGFLSERRPQVWKDFCESAAVEGATLADVASAVVKELCGIQSRSQLGRGTDADQIWRELCTEFDAWETTQRYAGSIHR